MMVHASTPCNVITPEMRAGRANSPRGRAVWKALGIEVEYIHVQSRQFFGHQLLWINNWQQVAITDPERTAFDLIARPDVFGGMAAAIEILEGALPQLNLVSLVQYALQYKVGAAIKRLGWVLEQLGIPVDSLTPLQAHPVTTYYRLDPQGPTSSYYSARWRIIENLGDRYA
jgi:predicted transcriptional regulator of viral defense system